MTGIELATKRKFFGLKAYELGGLIGVNAAKMSRVEKGLDPLPADAAAKAEQIFAKLEKAAEVETAQ